MRVVVAEVRQKELADVLAAGVARQGIGLVLEERLVALRYLFLVAELRDSQVEACA